ncbi:MAG: glycosyltransferase [Acidaminococcaceae bacterium]|nr:glycosyltransferase [Acidaminococcaceae bacterium]
MKVMQICFSPIVNSIGGVEKVFCNMSNHFCKKYIVVDVCCDNEIGRPFYYLSEDVDFINLNESEKIKVPLGVKILNEMVRPLKQIGLGLEFPKEIHIRKQIKNRLKSILEDKKPDVVICYELRSMVAIAECGYPLSKMVVMFHMDAKTILDSLSKKQDEILRKVKFVQVLLGSYKKLLDDKGYMNVVSIGNIVPQYDDVNFSLRETTIIHVGRLDKIQKRQHLLIKAFSKIATKFPDWNLKFYGGDPLPLGYDNELRKIIAKNCLEKQVHLMGTTSEIESQLRKASIFAFPSAFEGFPLALTEAMSIGLPTVGFKETPAVNELIKNNSNGILCIDNVDALASALEELILDKNKRIQYGQKGKEDMKKYSDDSIFGKWECLLNMIKDEATC